MMQDSNNGIPMRPFGESGVNVSALGFGGHHIGDAESEEVAIRLVQTQSTEASPSSTIAGSIIAGKSEEWMGKGLKRRSRDKVFLMSKVCTHGRERDLALRMLEESLRRLQTDHLDLWQIHGVSLR